MQPGAGDHLGGQAEPLGDRERVARPGVPVLEPERRLEPLGVERDRRVLEARLHLGEDLERLEVRRGHDARAAVERAPRGARRRAPRPPSGRCPRPARRGGPATPAPRRSRISRTWRTNDENVERFSARLCSSPITASTRSVNGHAAARRGGDVAAGLGHQDEQPGGLERDGLAARVRAAQDQAGPVAPAPGGRSGSPRRRRTRRPSAGRPAGGGAPRGGRGRRRRPPPARPRRAARRASARAKTRSRSPSPSTSSRRAGRMRRTPSVSSASRRSSSSRSSRQTRVSSLLSGIVSSGSTNTVAPLCERSWMMPRTPAPSVVADRNHVAAVPHGDVALLERRLDGGVIEEPLDARLEIGPERRDLAPQRAEPRAGAVREPAVGVERVVERRGEVGELGKGGPRAGEAGRHGPDALAIRPEPGGGCEPAPQRDQRGSVEHGARRRCLGQDRSGIAGPVPGGRPLGRQGAAGLGGFLQRGLHGVEGRVRHQRPGAVAPGWRAPRSARGGHERVASPGGRRGSAPPRPSEAPG